MADAAVSSRGMNRREFLYYIWGASMALFAAQSVGAVIWFLIPKFREGEFGGSFTLPTEKIPAINDEPFNFPDGRFWLVNLDSNQENERMYPVSDEPDGIQGVAAIYKVCTHLGCIYAWNTANQRFECPCHGSKYRLDGRRVESPAPRTLDRFELSAVDESGAILATAELDENDFYKPLVLPAGTTAVQIDTGALKQGPSQRLICDFRGNCP
jgi:cytochrome b6-f complex iron-sulfur subunit